MIFEGFPAEAFSFYEHLESDNSREFWSSHKAEYQRFVREPMIALAEELEAEFGPATVFRPNRDIRFSADKSPFKTYQGMFVERVPGTGLYAQLSADGVMAGGGFHSHSSDQVERYRSAVDASASGSALADIVASLGQQGLSISGDQLKTRPRGVRDDHPRLELLRYRSLTASKEWSAGPAVSGRSGFDLIRQAWQQFTPLCDWLGEHVGAPLPAAANRR
jgi:uncharacterized protein (TIGR02453 family)